MVQTKTITEFETHLFHEGTYFESYRKFGAHLSNEKGTVGTRFTVWAPNAKKIEIVGSFNDWHGEQYAMNKITTSGIWSLFIPEVTEGELYKYKIYPEGGGEPLLKADPYAFYSEKRPKSASIVYSLEGYNWGDREWQRKKRRENILKKPVSIYEVHLGSWKKTEDGDFLSYRELAHDLVDYVKEMGYTHIELLPVVEHPFDRSWGYQATGYFSVTSRYGTPKDFMYFVDRCHQEGIGVILDWNPCHFCRDGHGLRLFDGAPVFEYQDPHRAENTEWDTNNFDLGKPEVISFLVSNAFFWFDLFHIDGLRVDAVSSILYMDYGKEDGEEWLPNKYGGRENLEGLNFLRTLNEAVFERFPNVMMVAEESTSWPLVSKPTYSGGLGFNFKWNMGWMNDMLEYMKKDPIHRKHHHQNITFSFLYAFSENFVLPLSHDEVVHSKRSLLNKMPGDYWQKFANLRVLLGYQMGHPGKKLLFMGGELGQFDEWKDLEQLDWNLLQFEFHWKMRQYCRQLNQLYTTEPALYEQDHTSKGFEWIDPHDHSQSIISFIRWGYNFQDHLIIVCNFTPQVYHGYRIGVPKDVSYKEIFNSDAEEYGGSGILNSDELQPHEVEWHHRPYSIELNIPPLATFILKPLAAREEN
ncbi:1,4-alpha-glucan branching protein GlgB [Natranaerobius thermophilus JW/NM-WN-LF]|uniref:1,4-alpha-glucan branching enzyme GlgB n=1 Tax=Natranaerobius thermophilus (strain ATCC BAA-1301 / DSM 18059 / JW/NM-WN-LF) TaxID=457570 RepID=B2A6F0_NATTJ|nr:1,4-alpha-glucan branching protein GlgB [Natranaerobius thermophilus]ACB84158.1 1,4-alpha-glucan branching enzyme [Natranaerobius thermophilus JW/NM-WN-LF]